VQSTEVGRIAQNDWRPVGIDELEPEAWSAVRHPGSSFVVAGPGAGKTEFLAQRADYLFATSTCSKPQSVLAISFKRDAARNLANRVKARTPNAANRFDSMTFDAFTKGIVDRFRSALPPAWRMNGDYQVWFPNRNDAPLHLDDLVAAHPDEAQDIAALPRFNFVREVVGTYPLPLTLPDVFEGAEELASLAWWDRHFRRTEPHRVDFVMLNRLAELIVRANPTIHRALLLTYPYVFIDEFQDTTYAQYSFLRSVFGTDRTILTAVGDDKQRIMGWAGALDDAFAEFQSDFAATRFRLSWNFRSSEALTELHHVVAHTLDAAATPAVSQVVGSVDGHPLEIWQFDNARDEARTVARWISEDCASSGRSPERYALLARQKTVDLQPILEEELARVGLPLRNDDGLIGDLRLQDVLADDLVVLVLDILRLAASRGGNGPAWMRVCTMMARMHDRSADDDVISRSEKRLESFLTLLRRWMRQNPPGAEAVERVVDETVDYLGEAAIQSTFLVHRRRAFLDQTVAALKARLHEVADTGTTWEALCDRTEGRGAVPLMTIHKSKGLEYHTVVFLGLDDHQWWSFSQNPAEAIRTFFVGLSRAEQRTVFTYCTARGKRTDIASLYDLLALGNVPEVSPAQP